MKPEVRFFSYQGEQKGGFKEIFMTAEAKHSIYQFIKFGLVGVLNTLVDLGVFNLLIFIFGLATGYFYIIFKAVSFFVAVANSYVFNKYFVFKLRDGEESAQTVKKELAVFFAVSVVGLFLNVAVSYAVFSWGSMLELLAPGYALANIGALAGTAVVLLWNFIGYKWFVFKFKK